MTEDEINQLISRMRTKKQRHDRKQLFDWATRHLSAEQKQHVEKQVWEKWNVS